MPRAKARPGGDGAAAVDHGNQTWLAILNQMPVGVTVVELPNGRFILQNSVGRAILGRAPGTMDDAVYLRYDAAHPDGRPYSRDEYPLSRAMRKGELVEREPLYYRRPDGSLIILEVNASVVTAADGQQLGVCTFQDVTEEYKRRDDLREAAERVQLALHAGAIVGTWVWDVQSDVMTADVLFAESFGMDPERCRLGFPAGEGLVSIHPADRESVETAVAVALANGGAYRSQYRVRQADGGYRWVEASGWVELGPAGEPIRFPGVLMDITAWKHADEARALLMQEVDHRARNALAMVQAVVRLTDSTDSNRYREEITGRIDTMARAQGSLSRTNWEGADLEDVVREELAAHAADSQFTLGGPRVTLPPDQVQPISMIVHELAANALKYGALSTEAGLVEVDWRIAPGAEIELIWRERGGPAVGPPEHTGFGSRLILRLVRQLGATIDLEWPAEGFTATLGWPCEVRATATARSPPPAPPPSRRPGP